MSGAADDARACRALAERARAARQAVAGLAGGERRALLREIADGVRRAGKPILDANRADLGAASGLSDALRDRLRLDEARLDAMARAIEAIADQPDPVGKVVEGRTLANGIRLEKRRVPLGVVLVIYESRPNVTTDAAALCLKSGNACVLRGGRESARTNAALVDSMRPALESAGVGDGVVFVDVPGREAVGHLVKLRGVIDLVVPRGGRGLIDAVCDAATIPVVKHDAGNCHVYIDASLEGLEETALAIAVNAKAQRPGVCNAMETLLVHEAVADALLPRIGDAMRAAGVELRADARALVPLGGAVSATEADWATEFLAPILAVKVVDSLDDACAHIAGYGSGHTDAIVTSSIDAAERFTRGVDSASVMVNCSTRFADGAEYGLGAEIGISTDKLHARGPMGAEDLTTYQWVLRGSGQVRA